MSADSYENEYASWHSPDGTWAVNYALPVFQEIEFLAGEGYRRIPHGGIEVAGLLFGRIENDQIRIGAFRSIECEHAFGPSFVLSPRDTDALNRQLESSASDPELNGMKAIGWFIAHTRSNLQINEREHEIQDRLFKSPGSVTVLVKPERFKPTRFAFFVRSRSGEFDRAEAQQPILLPSPSQATSRRAADHPAPRQIPELSSENKAERLSANHETPSDRLSAVTPTEPAVPRAAGRPSDTIAAETPPSAGKSAFAETEDAQLSQASFHAKLEAQLPASTGRSIQAITPASVAPDRKTQQLLTASKRETGFAPVLPARPTTELRHSRDQITRPLGKGSKPSTARVTAVLICAAILGCLVGYYAYSQLPAVIIPLSVQVRQQGLYVSWPAEQTRNTTYSAIRIDDGAPIPLSPQEKTIGGTQISTLRSDTKIELIAQHWPRESRGIVRYVSGIRDAARSETPAEPATAQPPLQRAPQE